MICQIFSGIFDFFSCRSASAQACFTRTVWWNQRWNEGVEWPWVSRAVMNFKFQVHLIQENWKSEGWKFHLGHNTAVLPYFSFRWSIVNRVHKEHPLGWGEHLFEWKGPRISIQFPCLMSYIPISLAGLCLPFPFLAESNMTWVGVRSSSTHKTKPLHRCSFCHWIQGYSWFKYSLRMYLYHILYSYCVNLSFF